MLYYFKDKHRLSEVKLEFKGQNYMFNSYEMELYSAAAPPSPRWCHRRATAHRHGAAQARHLQPHPAANTSGS
jgi:hypothetical protein